MTDTKAHIGCVKLATEIIGNKWTPLLLRFFANEEPLRFCRLQDLAGGINPRTLSSRLSDLESSGIINKSSAESTSYNQYSLTTKGRELLPIIRDMEQWSIKYSAS